MTLRDLLRSLGYGILLHAIHPAILNLKLSEVQDILTQIEARE